MASVTDIGIRELSRPQHGWLWVHDYHPGHVRQYLLVSAIIDWFFWHCAISVYRPSCLKNYRCDEPRAAEMVDCLDRNMDIGCSGPLYDLHWEQLDFCVLKPLVYGAARDGRSLGEDCSSLFMWSASRSDEKIVLEDYIWRIVWFRGRVFNSGNYHELMNLLDFYDMEINRAYAEWVSASSPRLEQEIRSLIREFRRVVALAGSGRFWPQWRAEASWLGLTEDAAAEHWSCLGGHLYRKAAYHQTRLEIIEKSVNSRFSPRLVLAGTDNLTHDFGRSAIDYSEARIRLLDQDHPEQLSLL